MLARRTTSETSLATLAAGCETSHSSQRRSSAAEVSSPLADSYQVFPLCTSGQTTMAAAPSESASLKREVEQGETRYVEKDWQKDLIERRRRRGLKEGSGAIGLN